MNEYRTFADAKRDGAVSRGWVPAALPASAVNIKERHNLDTNEVSGQFDVRPSDITLFANGLREASRESLRCVRRVPSDWFAKASSAEMRYYRAQSTQDGDTVYFAIDAQRGKCCYWMCSR